MTKNLPDPNQSRGQLFEDVEKDYRRTLPSVRYQIFKHKKKDAMLSTYQAFPVLYLHHVSAYKYL